MRMGSFGCPHLPRHGEAWRVSETNSGFISERVKRMSNMSYCRFTNTLADLSDCEDNMYEELEGEEYDARVALVEMCAGIAREFGNFSKDDFPRPPACKVCGCGAIEDERIVTRGGLFCSEACEEIASEEASERSEQD